MATKCYFSNIFKKSKQVFQGIFKGQTQKAGIKVSQIPKQTQNATYQLQTTTSRIKLLNAWNHFNSIASHIGRQAAWRYGRNLPLFSFAGLVMAHQDNAQAEDNVNSPLLQKIKELSLEQFEIGKPIGQGCNAAVYEAHLKTDCEDENNSEVEDNESNDTGDSFQADIEESPIVHEDISDTEADSNGSRSDILSNQGLELSKFMSCAESVAKFIEKMDEAPDKRKILDRNADEYNSLDGSFTSGIPMSGTFNLAVKMMFNYVADSNADAIMKEMERETIPARLAMSHGQMEIWQNGHTFRKKRLPPHPNIVEMWGVFVGPVPHLLDSLRNYPAALPARINPHGIGRNMTLFLVMKKYQYSLREYLSTFNPSLHERLILLAQLLEAVCHMRRHSIAHRDLKLDNIFLDTSMAGIPQLVVGDFGCCLADKLNGLKIPYNTEQIDRGGNAALMAPEISTAEPGPSSYLDYSKSDLWATGALAYEILGADNPFYTHANKRWLDSRTYSKEELPPLPDDVPGVVKQLVSLMLEREASTRPTARFAADVLHVFLWMPSDWLSPGNKLSSSKVDWWWFIFMATEVKLGVKSAKSYLKRSFLENINMNRLSDAFQFLGAKIE